MEATVHAPLDRRKLDGRLQLEMVGVRSAPDTGRVVEDTLRAIPGVVDVHVDPSTGAVAILYEPHPSGAAKSPPEPAPAAPVLLPALPTIRRPPPATFPWIVQTVVVVALEVTLQRLLGSVFGRRH